MTSFADRARALTERVDGERPESWQPNDPSLGHPPVLVGELLRVDVGHTAYGETRIVVLRDAEGKDWGVWLFKTVLAQEFQSLKPQQGELVAVKYLGTVHSKSGGSDYEGYRVEIERSSGIVNWEAVPGEQLTVDHHEPPNGAVPPPETLVAEVCEQCGFHDGEHAVGCPNEIPF